MYILIYSIKTLLNQSLKSATWICYKNRLNIFNNLSYPGGVHKPQMISPCTYINQWHINRL